MNYQEDIARILNQICSNGNENKCHIPKCCCKNCCCPSAIIGPPGEKGATGAPGEKGSTGAPGEKGATGTADTITVRNTITGNPDTKASVTDVTGSPNHVLDFVIPRGATGAPGEKGATGAPGEKGATGATGPPGRCCCRGEMLRNGSMESFDKTVPIQWYTAAPSLISRTTDDGEVHTGDSAVKLKNGAVLTQRIALTDGGCHILSFFALASGTRTGVTAKLDFLDGKGNRIAGTVVRAAPKKLPAKPHHFGMYQGVGVAPETAVFAEVCFTAETGADEYLILDDISLLGL